jgi:hypothetical protein
MTGTLITMSATPYAGILDPIYLRLENPDGILRKTSDSSMLLEALLDIGKPFKHRTLLCCTLTSCVAETQSSISQSKSHKPSRPKS